MKLRRGKWLFAAMGTTLLLAGVSQPALADDSCAPLIAWLTQQLPSSAYFYYVQYTMHREDVPLITHSDGIMSPDGSGGFGGGGDQLFSDRTAENGQPFDINQADHLDWALSPNGRLWIHYHPWEFETTWDMTCHTGRVLSTYVPGFGVFSLSFREYSVIL
jgi:hypothetical protein